jgi:hypothetical protein
VKKQCASCGKDLSDARECIDSPIEREGDLFDHGLVHRIICAACFEKEVRAAKRGYAEDVSDHVDDFKARGWRWSPLSSSIRRGSMQASQTSWSGMRPGTRGSMRGHGRWWRTRHARVGAVSPGWSRRCTQT